MTSSLALSGCKLLKDYYGHEPDAAAHHGEGGHDEHGGGHEGAASEHVEAADGAASAAASAPLPPASTVVDGEVHCTNPRHLAFSARGISFCALPCRGAGFDQDCPDGAKCSANAPMVEKGKLGAYKSYCVSKVTTAAGSAGTVVAVDPTNVPLVDSGTVVAELTDAGLKPVAESDAGGATIHDVAKSLRGRIKKK